MPLVDMKLSIDRSDLPSDVRDFLREAYLRVGQHVRNSPIRVSGFAPSGFATVYQSLRAIMEAKLAPGNAFCEWGSGFGVASSLAAMLKFRAYGIEIERGLVDASKRLANDFGLSVKFVHGSFVPPEGRAIVDEAHANNIAEFFDPVMDAVRCAGFSGQSVCLFPLGRGAVKAAREALSRPRADAAADPRCGFRLMIRF